MIGMQVAQHWVPSVIFLRIEFFTIGFFLTTFAEDAWNLFLDVALLDVATRVLRRCRPSMAPRLDEAAWLAQLRLAAQSSLGRVYAVALLGFLLILDFCVVHCDGKAVITPHSSQYERVRGVLGYVYLLVWDLSLSALAVHLLRLKLRRARGEHAASSMEVGQAILSEYAWQHRHALIAAVLWATLGTVDLLHDNSMIWT